MKNITIQNYKQLVSIRADIAFEEKVNRFVIMCVEHYAYSVNKSSSETYFIMKDSGVIKEIMDDYEDMHGMSTYSINEYIGKRLSLNSGNNSKKSNHVLAKTILITQTVELLVKKYNISILEARDRLYKSDVIRMLDDDGTGLYGESALYLMSLYEMYENNH